MDAFARQVDGLSAGARRQLASQLADVDVYDYERIAAIMRDVCGPYTDMSAALAARFYDGIREAAGAPGEFHAEADSGYDPQKLTAAAKAVAAESAAGGGEAALASLMGAVADREINNASRECVRRNAKRDPAKPRCASVPTGSNPCEWCVMRASAGFVYAQASGSHKNCRCRLVPGFDGSAKVEGYDQSRYERMYYDAADAWRKGDIPDELNERIAAAKERHERDLKTGRATKEWDDTNAILMVMREQRK